MLDVIIENIAQLLAPRATSSGMCSRTGKDHLAYACVHVHVCTLTGGCNMCALVVEHVMCECVMCVFLSGLKLLPQIS